MAKCCTFGPSPASIQDHLQQPRSCSQRRRPAGRVARLPLDPRCRRIDDPYIQLERPQASVHAPFTAQAASRPSFFIIFHPGRRHRQPHPSLWTHPGVTSDPRVQHDLAGSPQLRCPPFRTMANSSTNRVARHNRPTRMSPFKMRSMVTGRTSLTRTHPGLERYPQHIITCTMLKARVLNTTRQRCTERRVSCGQTGRRSTPTIDNSTTATTLLRWRRSTEGE
jgi:hypothetical protein